MALDTPCYAEIRTVHSSSGPFAFSSKIMLLQGPQGTEPFTNCLLLLQTHLHRKSRSNRRFNSCRSAASVYGVPAVRKRVNVPLGTAGSAAARWTRPGTLEWMQRPALPSGSFGFAVVTKTSHLDGITVCVIRKLAWYLGGDTLCHSATFCAIVRQFVPFRAERMPDFDDHRKTENQAADLTRLCEKGLQEDRRR